MEYLKNTQFLPKKKCLFFTSPELRDSWLPWIAKILIVKRGVDNELIPMEEESNVGEKARWSVHRSELDWIQ